MILRPLPWHHDILLEEIGRSDALPHAYLMAGVAGIGKSAFAQALAAALLCEAKWESKTEANATQARPAEVSGAGSVSAVRQPRLACGQCPACVWTLAGHHPDLRLIEPFVDDEGKATRDIRIEQIRSLADFLAVGGHRSGRRLVIIDPADALNAPAANALLKTLEEPGEGVVFLLLTDRPDALPATIRSRCRLLFLPAPALGQASAWVQGETGCSAAEATQWLAMTGGSPRQAAGLAQSGQADLQRRILEALARLPDDSVMAVADALLDCPARQWLPVLQRWLMDVMRCGAGARPRYFPLQQGRLEELAARSDPEARAKSATRLAGQFKFVDHPLNPRLFCEQTLEAYLDAYPRA